MSGSTGQVDLDDLELVFRALAHPARRHLLQVLSARGTEMAAGDLAARFSHSWPTTTRHLQVLSDAGLVSERRSGLNRLYRFERDVLGERLDLWLGSVGMTVKWHE